MEGGEGEAEEEEGGKQEKVEFLRLGVGVQYHGRCAGAVGVCRRVQSRHGTHALPYVLWSRTISNLCLGQMGIGEEKKKPSGCVPFVLL